MGNNLCGTVLKKNYRSYDRQPWNARKDVNLLRYVKYCLIIVGNVKIINVVVLFNHIWQLADTDIST